MTFVADERGRVPFALVAALLLVSTAAYTGGLVHEEPDEPVVPRLVEGATQEARMQLGTTARAAGRAAAREPVQTVATTRLGRVLADDPFNDSLDLRIAVRARDAVAANRTARDATVTVSVPPISDVTDAQRAVRAVRTSHLEGERYRVTLENVSVTVRRDGRVVERDTVRLETTVALPAVAAHRRTQRFEERLTAGLGAPGLNRGLTARLFALAWVRGYAQYGGAPISNVVANRHVGVLTNDALVDQQVAAFGRADPDSRRGVARAAASVAVADGARGAESIAQGLVDRAAKSAAERGRSGGDTSDGDARTTDDTDANASLPAGQSLGALDTPSVMDEPRSVDVNQTADAAFVSFVDGRGLDSVLARAYRADVRPETSARRTDTDVYHDGERPENGTERFSYTTTDRSVRGNERSAGHESTVLEYDRTVTVTETEHTYWTVNRTFAGTTSRSVERTYAVSVRVDCRYDRPGGTPGGRVTDRCPFGATARDDLRREAAAAMRSRFGGVDDVAEVAVSGARDYRWASVSVDPPDAAREHAYRSTASLRDDVRDVTVDVQPASMASTANPASRLSEQLGDRRARFVDAPSRYRSASTVAATLARDRYLDAVRADLGEQSSSFAGMQDALGDAMADRAVPASPPDRDPAALPPIASSVDADPRYLSLEARSGSPNLAARNVNLFTVPYGDAADTVGAAIGDGSDATVSLATATNTLEATNRALAADDDGEVRAKRARLRRGIRSSVQSVRDAQRRALQSSTSLSRHEARNAVAAGYDRHDSVAARGQAVVDGSIATAVAAALPASLSPTERDRARVALRVATTDARDDQRVRLSESVVSPVADGLRSQVREGVEQSVRVGTHRAATVGKRRAMKSAAAEMPAGLPLLPVPGQWYATANVWVVSVRGGYDRFAVRTPRAAPAYGTNGTVTYVREDAPVTLDVDGDGVAETLGRNEAIELSADTGVVVVVPPGPAGVGDTDGNADERSPGW